MKDFIKHRLQESLLHEYEEQLFYHGSPYSFDKFDITRVGTGDGLSKYGHGLYFADNIQTALYYAKELSIGDLKTNGFNLYSVKLFNIDQFHQWEKDTPDEIAHCVYRKLQKIGENDLAESMMQEYNDYGNFWSIRSMYEILNDTLGSKAKTSEFLSICGLNGVIAQSPAHEGNVYVAYDDSIIKILNVEKIK